MGCHRTTVLRQIQCGYIKATSIFNERNQLVYQIPLSALHPEAQLRYFKEHGQPFPLATEKPASAKAYKPLDHFSAAEREEIRQEMETLERWQEYRRQPGRTAELDAEFVELLRQEEDKRPDPQLVMHTLLVVRALTRIWRRSVNLAEQVYFMQHGQSLKHSADKK